MAIKYRKSHVENPVNNLDNHSDDIPVVLGLTNNEQPVMLDTGLIKEALEKAKLALQKINDITLIPGPPGKNGVGVYIMGVCNSTSELPDTDCQLGDAYLVKGILYVYVGENGDTNGGLWQSVGNIVGETGADGADGLEGLNTFITNDALNPTIGGSQSGINPNVPSGRKAKSDDIVISTNGKFGIITIVDSQSSVTVITKGSMSVASSGSGWETFPNATRSSTTVIDVGESVSKCKKGLPVKFKIGSTYYYALITDISGNNLTLSGAPISSQPTEFYLGSSEKVVIADFGFNEYWSAYQNGTANVTINGLMDLHLGGDYIWGNSDGYLVQIGAKSKVADSGTTSIQVMKNSTLPMNSTVLNVGTSFLCTGSSSININNYKIGYLETLDINVTRSAATATAKNLTLMFWFILE